MFVAARRERASDGPSADPSVQFRAGAIQQSSAAQTESRSARYESTAAQHERQARIDRDLSHITRDTKEIVGATAIGAGLLGGKPGKVATVALGALAAALQREETVLSDRADAHDAKAKSSRAKATEAKAAEDKAAADASASKADAQKRGTGKAPPTKKSSGAGHMGSSRGNDYGGRASEHRPDLGGRISRTC